MVLIWGSWGHAAQPLSAIDWLSRPPAEQMSETSTSDSSDMVSGVALPSIVRSGELTQFNINSAGLITAASAGLPNALWPADQIDLAVDHLTQLPALKSKEANLLLAALLMAESETSTGLDTIPLFMARIEKLVDLGAVEAAATLIALTEGQDDPRLTRLALDIDLIRGPAQTACEQAIERQSLSTHDADRLSEIYCHVMLQNWHEAEVLLSASEALNLLSDLDLELIWQFIDPEYADTAAPPALEIANLTPIRFQLIESLGATPFLIDAPTPYQWSYLNGRTGWKLQIGAAEKLVRAGVVSGNALLDYYTARKPSASGGVWERAAAVQRLDTATPEHRAEAFAEAFEVFAQTNDLILLAEIAYALDLGQYPDIASDPQWVQLMILAHPQTVATISALGSKELDFALSLLQRDTNAERALSTSDPLAAALWAALSQEVEPLTPTGPRITEALKHISSGENGDMSALSLGLTELRAMGLDDRAWRIAAQIFIMDGA